MCSVFVARRPPRPSVLWYSKKMAGASGVVFNEVDFTVVFPVQVEQSWTYEHRGSYVCLRPDGLLEQGRDARGKKVLKYSTVWRGRSQSSGWHGLFDEIAPGIPFFHTYFRYFGASSTVMIACAWTRHSHLVAMGMDLQLENVGADDYVMTDRGLLKDGEIAELALDPHRCVLKQISPTDIPMTVAVVNNDLAMARRTMTTTSSSSSSISMSDMSFVLVDHDDDEIYLPSVDLD